MIRKETIRYLEFKSHPARRELFASFLPGVFCPITGYRAQEGLWRGYRQDVERGGGGGGDVKKYLYLNFNQLKHSSFKKILGIQKKKYRFC